MRLSVLRTAAIISTRAFSTIEQRHLVAGSAITKILKNSETHQKATTVIFRIKFRSLFSQEGTNPGHGAY
jgi:hypothetical protein